MLLPSILLDEKTTSQLCHLNHFRFILLLLPTLLTLATLRSNFIDQSNLTSFISSFHQALIDT